MAPEVMVLVGLFMVVGSIFALAIAQYVRDWFFTPDLRAQLLPVKARRTPDHRTQSRPKLV